MAGGAVSVNTIDKQCTVTVDGLKTVTVNQPVASVEVVAVGVAGPPGPKGPKGDPANVDDFELQDLTLIFDNNLI